MICYLDSSVVLRKLLGQPNLLKEWSQVEKAFSSRLLRIECLRTLDRLRLIGALSDEGTSQCRDRFYQTVRKIGLLPMTSVVLNRAEESFPVSVGSLDSIHLATALLLRERNDEPFVFATHDKQLGMAARSQGFRVIGAENL